MSKTDPEPITDRWLWTILLLGLGLRLVRLWEPLIDEQAWRQTDTAAIARNFYEETYNILYPRVDWRGTTEGYVETNFPLFPFLVACIYGLIGSAQEWVGRLLAALFCTGAGGLLYLLARRLYCNLWVARFSTLLFFIFPVNIFFGRAFMPEAAMLFFTVAALLSFDRWVDTRRRADFVLAAASAGLCFLVKIPTLYLGFPLVALVWARWGWGFLRLPVLWLYLLLVLLPAALWYWHANQLFQQTGLTFGIWNQYGYDKWSNELLFTWEFYFHMAQRFSYMIFTPPGTVLVLLGLALGCREKKEWMLYAWMGGLLLYLVLIPEGNHRLQYYQIPFIPAGAVLAARVLAMLLEPGHAESSPSKESRWVGWLSTNQRRGLVLLAVLSVGGFGAWATRYDYGYQSRLYEYSKSRHAAGQILDEKLPADALLVVGDIDSNFGTPRRAQNPVMLYYCHRKGWQIAPEEFSRTTLDSLADLGADYFLASRSLVKEQTAFWNDLLRRGLTIPSAYPRWSNSADQIDPQGWYRGPDRHFVLVRLGQD